MPLPPPRSHAKASSVPTLSQDISTSVTSIAAAFWRQADLRLRRRAPRPQLHRSQLRRSQLRRPQLRRRVSTTYSWFTPLARLCPRVRCCCVSFYQSGFVIVFTPQHTRELYSSYSYSAIGRAALRCVAELGIYSEASCGKAVYCNTAP
eukprot:scaffold27097_cov75-Phaeocystis_antarctica.AAC.2